MAVVKPFRGLRPPAGLASEIACLPYDVMNSEEAAVMAKGKEKSLLHITKSEIDLPEGTDVHSEEVYRKALENFTAVAEKRMACSGSETLFLYLCPDNEGPYPVRNCRCSCSVTIISTG